MRVSLAFLAFAAAVFMPAPASAQVASMKTSAAMTDRGTVKVEQINIPGAGFLVVESGVRGEKPLAVVALRKGLTPSVIARLSRPAQPGEAFEIRVHADYGVKGRFEPNADPVALSADTKAP